MRLSGLAFGLALITALSACGGNADIGAGDEPEPVATSEAAQSSEESVSEESSPGEEMSSASEAEPTADDGDDGVDDNEQVEDWQVALEIVDGPATFTAAEGLTLEILDAQINDLPNAPADVQAEVEFAFDDGLSPVAGIQMRVTNDTDTDIEWFANQATLVVGGTGLEPDLFLSDSLGTTEGLLSGTTAQADVLYVLPPGTAVADITNAEVRLRGSAPLDPESFEEVGDEIDMTFSWAAA